MTPEPTIETRLEAVRDALSRDFSIKRNCMPGNSSVDKQNSEYDCKFGWNICQAELLPLLQEMLKTITAAEKYFTSCAYHKCEKDQPEYQMTLDFRKAVAKVEAYAKGEV